VPRAASSFAGSKTIKRVAHKTTRYAGGCSSDSQVKRNNSLLFKKNSHFIKKRIKAIDDM